MLTTQLATTRLAELVDRAIADLQTVRRLLPATVQRLDDTEPGYPSGGPSSGGDDAPLRSMVIAAQAQDRANYHKLIGRTTADARNLLGIAHRYGITRHGNNEGVDERSLLCDSCGYNDRGDRRCCQWCTRTLKAINDIRAGIGRAPLSKLPRPALEHVRNGRTKSVRPADLERWARDGGKRN